MWYQACASIYEEGEVILFAPPEVRPQFDPPSGFGVEALDFGPNRPSTTVPHGLRLRDRERERDSEREKRERDTVFPPR